MKPVTLKNEPETAFMQRNAAAANTRELHMKNS